MKKCYTEIWNKTRLTGKNHKDYNKNRKTMKKGKIIKTNSNETEEYINNGNILQLNNFFNEIFIYSSLL